MFNECKTPEQAARRLHKHITENILGTLMVNNAYLWSPEETAERGWGSGWAVCWEDGPYDWAVVVSMGGLLYGDNIELLGHSDWFAEPYNGFVLNFYE